MALTLVGQDVSPELLAARTKLGTLHDILAVLRSGRMPPEDWPKAKAALELLDGLITETQAVVDALQPKPALADDEADDGNQTPDPDSTVIPDLAAKPVDSGLAEALARRADAKPVAH